jgi:hypothetical protein
MWLKTDLEHLNERHTEVQIRQVTQDQTQAEHDTDGHNSPPVTLSAAVLPESYWGTGN